MSQESTFPLRQPLQRDTVCCATRTTAWLATFALLTAIAPRAGAQEGVAPPRFEPCGSAAVIVECAQLTVRERPRDTTSREISLRMVRIRQHRAEPATTATFVLAGGPGAAASDMARGGVSGFEAWTQHGDVVLLDQRGTDAKSPLRCPAGAEFDPFSGILPREALTRCRAGIASLADIDAFGTHQAAEDIEVARTVLGYEQVNLLGLSYGTRLALEYMEQHPERVRAAVLDGVMPRELRTPLHYAADAEAALLRLSDVCWADERCRAFGRPEARYRALMSRLASMPATVMLPVSPSGPERQVSVGPRHLAYAVRALLYGSAAVDLPRLLAHADSAGDLTAFARHYAQRVSGVAQSASNGLHLSVLCAEDVATITGLDIVAATKQAVAGSYIVDQYIAACRQWRVSPRDVGTTTARLTAPLLLLSGAMDPVTPPRWGEVVLARSQGARHLVFPYGGHIFAGPGMGSCKSQLIREFLQTPRAEALDTSCMATAAPPEFRRPD